jgi:hypothetical protein
MSLLQRCAIHLPTSKPCESGFAFVFRQALSALAIHCPFLDALIEQGSVALPAD